MHDVRRASFLVLGAFALVPFLALGCEGEQSPNGGAFTFDGGFIAFDASSADGQAGPPPETKLTVTPDVLSNDPNPRFEFTSSQPGTFGCRLDQATPVECTSPFTIPVTEGTHTFQVAAVSQFGLDVSPASFTWTVDLTAPKTTLSKKPAAVDNSTTVSFEFSADEASTFTCAIDGNAAAPCTSPWTTSNLTDGAHTVTILAKDPAGNAASPLTYAWNLDTTLPDTVIGSGPTGQVNTTTASFTFSSPNAGTGATFACSFDGAAFTACTSPASRAGLTNAAHTFRVRVTDAAKNTDPTPAERTWTVDTVPPVVTITGGPTGPTNGTAPTFTFTAPGATTACRILPAAFAACTSPFTAPTLAEGARTFEVRGTDPAGNAATASRSFTVDTTVPSIVINTGPSGPTNDATPSFGFTSGAGAVRTSCQVDGAGFNACTSPFTTATLSNAAHTFDVRAFDAAGNFATASRSFTVDTVPPIVTIDSGPTGLTNNRQPSFDFTVTGATTITCQVDSGNFAACTSPLVIGRPGLVDGAHTIRVRGADAAGNVVTVPRSFTVDGTAPVVTLTGPSGVWTSTTAQFTFSVTGAPTAIECSFDGAAFAACTSPVRYIRLPQGAHSFAVRAPDSAGNTGSAINNFFIDSIPPTLTFDQGADQTPAAFEMFYFTPGADSVSTQCRLYPAGSPQGAYVDCASPYNAAMPGPGSWTFEVRVRDAAGNVNTVTHDIFVYIIG